MTIDKIKGLTGGSVQGYNSDDLKKRVEQEAPGAKGTQEAVTLNLSSQSADDVARQQKVDNIRSSVQSGDYNTHNDLSKVAGAINDFYKR